MKDNFTKHDVTIFKFWISNANAIYMCTASGMWLGYIGVLLGNTLFVWNIYGYIIVVIIAFEA